MKTHILSLLMVTYLVTVFSLPICAGEWISLVEIQNTVGNTTKENGTIVLNPERESYTFDKIRVDYSKTSSAASCYLTIDYADTKTTALEIATNNISGYYINEDRNSYNSVSTLKANGTLISGSVYEYDLNSICNTTGKLFYARLWQKNFLPEQMQVYLIQNTQPESTTETETEATAEGALHGLFSIADETQVYFSQGNLQYNASTDTWRFAENQYNMLGADNSNISDTYDGWIDLFGWGTGDAPTKSISWDDDEYVTFTDWGTNAISNGGNTANTWRTLTKDEWAYLFETRENASSLYGFANINGINGVVILPDNWKKPSEVLFNNGWDYANNSYTLSDWSIMESSGAVFLPAAGYREGTEVHVFGTDGDYWSSTTGEWTYSAYGVDFESNNFNAHYFYGDLFRGRSVRLVKTACTIASGTCGYNLTWELSCDSVLTIRGEGVMDFDEPWMGAPWQSWSDMIKTVEIEEGVMSIAVNAFNGCRSLTSAHLPNSITMIGSGAFTYCEKLTSIVIPANVFYLESCVFANCESLSLITFAGDLEGIHENCFQGCEALESVVLPNSVISIGSSAFIGCRNMRSITLSSNLTTMGYGVFTDCRSLESITIPKNTTNIGEAVFFACDSLSSVTVEEGNPVYDSRANCNAIIRTATNTLHAGCRKTIIPTSVTSIGNAAFQNISTLLSVSVPNTVTAIGSYAFSGTGLTAITFPNAITDLTEYVVGDCKDLRSMIIPASVTKVGWWIFAFDYNLDTIVCEAVTPPSITEYTFDYFYNQPTCHLYVPSESIDLYKAADGWRDFLNILPLEAIPTDIQCSSHQIIHQKLIRNGLLLILREGKTYNVQGLEVK